MRYPVILRHVLPIVFLAGVPAMAAAAPRFRAAPFPHLALRRSEPADSSVVPASPQRISLWFTARPQLAFTRISLTGPRGRIPIDSIVADSGNAIHARIPGVLDAGEYVVNWQTASADGHPIRGEFRFAVAGAMADTHTGHDTVVAGAASPPPGDSPYHTEWRAVRWLEFVGLLTVLGALGFRHAVLPPLASRGVPTADAADRARRLGQGALFLFGLAALLRLYSESVALNGRNGALDPDALRLLLTQTSWGMGWMTGVIGALLLAAGWTISRRTTIGTPLALTGALGMAASPALTGHAASSGAFIVAVTLDMVHVLAAGVWLGGLLMVLLAGIPAMLRLGDGNPHAAVSALVNSFHPMALFCAPAVVLAGIGTSILRLGGITPLVTTPYGYTLLVKLGLFLLVAGVALHNSTRGRRQLGTQEGTWRMRRSATAEILLVALLLAVTAFLVTTPAPSLMAG